MATCHFTATRDSPPDNSRTPAMDACIARGGISHVLSQARASLKNPSRPFTPQTSARPLFQGDGYRPTSRPSSSYNAAELQQMAKQQMKQKRTPSAPKPTKIPPRPSGLKARPPTVAEAQTASSNSLKLVHAPVFSDDELSVADNDSDDGQETVQTKFDPEALLTLPSNEELLQSYAKIDCCIQKLVDEAGSADFVAGVERLRELIDSFVGLSLFLHAGKKQGPAGAGAAKLRLRLFHNLSSVVLERWTTDATCVLELAPVLVNLYADTGDDSSDRESMDAQIIKLGKTLFVLSKNSDNDSCFCNVRYVEAILHAIAGTSNQATRHHDEEHSKDDDSTMFLSVEHPIVPMKMLIYAAGTLKNVFNADDKMARLLATNRAIAILSETMLWRADDAAKSKEIAQFLIQTTGILRNLSVSKSNHKQCLEAQIPLRLCRMIPAFIAHQELMVNISRILSKLTLHELPRAQINQRSANVGNLMALVDHRQNAWLSLADQQRSDMRFQDLLFIRVFFVLGNLCAGNDKNRRLVYRNFSGNTLLLEILQFYGSRYVDARNDTEITDADETEARRRAADAEQLTEVLVKLVRVIANLAINADVGAQLKENEGLTPLLEILEVAQRVGDEELMLNTVSCITNASYYSTGDGKNQLQSRDYCFIERNRVAITQLLSQILLERNEEAVVEAARAFGNLSRFKDVLAYMGELKVLDCLVVLLDHSNREVVYTICGVLMNAALDHSTRQLLLSVRPVVDDEAVNVRTLLIGIVECAAGDDLEMTLIASKALYNILLSKDISSTRSDGAVNRSCDARNLRRTIEGVLSSIGHTNAERRTNKEVGEPNEDEDEEASESWGSRQELCLVLPELLRSIDSLINPKGAIGTVFSDAMVHPATHQDQQKLEERTCAKAYHKVVNVLHRSKIGHRSEYSLERLLALRDYCQRASSTRVFAVCILTPLPAIAVALLIDCIPLRPPSDGWQANYAFWIRWFLAIVAVSVGVTAQVREVIPPGIITNAGALAIAVGTSVIDISIAITLAAVWRFPIPFGYILLVGPYLFIISSFTLMVIGPRLLAESSSLRQQLKSQITIIFVQGLVAMVYPFLTAVFYQLSGPQQTVFVVVMPIFKHVTKHAIAKAAEGLHEYVGPIVVFSVDVFNVFYVSICMQISKSTLTTLLIIASDSFHVVAALRDIFHQAKIIRAKGQEASVNYIEELPGMARRLFEDPDLPSSSRKIRVHAPFPLALSDDSMLFMNGILKNGQNTRNNSSLRAQTIGPMILAAQQTSEGLKPFVGSLNEPAQHQVAMTSPVPTLYPVISCKNALLPRKGSAPRRLLTLMNTDAARSAEMLRSSLSQTSAEQAVWDALQALFHSEYLLTGEYIECTLPVLYAIYLPILYYLPVAPYYPQTASSKPEKLRQDVINILMFAAVELAGFVGLLLLLRQKLGISPLYQLAFVLETQLRTVQGHLFVWTIFILHMPLMHYGVDYSIQFG